MNLKDVRCQAGISREQLAKAVGVNQSTIWRIENEKRRPSPELSRVLEGFFKGKITHTELLFPDYYSNPKTHTTLCHKIKNFFSRRSGLVSPSEEPVDNAAAGNPKGEDIKGTEQQ